MKLTEKEYLINNQQLSFRLRNLLKTDENAFHQIKEFLPFPMYMNSRNSMKYSYFSENFLNKGKEIELLYEKGGSYLDNISNPFLLKTARKKASLFDKNNDFDSICSYLQIIQLNNKPATFFTNKILVCEKTTLNTALFTNEFSSLDNIIQEFLPKELIDSKKWLIFNL